MVFPQRRAHQLAVQDQAVSPEDIHKGSITWREEVIFRNRLYVCISEGEWGKAYGRTWREKREGRNVVIKTSKVKQKNRKININIKRKR